MHWAIWDSMFKAQNAFEGVVSNFPSRFVSTLLRRTIFPLGRPYVVPSDKLGGQVADLLIAPSATRDRLTADMYLPRDEQDPVGVVELALEATIQAEAGPGEDPRRAEGRQAVRPQRAGDRKSGAGDGVITSAEHALLLRARELTGEVIKVDDFPFDLGLQRSEPKPAPRDFLPRAAAESLTT
jgi:acyl-CoA dehydrogenase